MKKFFAFFMLSVILLTLAACKANQENPIHTTGTESTVPATEETAATVSPTEATQPTESTSPSDPMTTTQSTNPVHNHSYSAATCTESAKCACGAIGGAALGHNYTPATCTAPQTCKTCSATTGTALGHNYSAATCTAPQTCKTCSATTGTALGHNYSAATCTTPQTCKTCSVTVSDPLGHNYVADNCTRCKDPVSTGCPRLYFTGNMSAMTSKKDVRNISFEYRSNGQNVTGAAKIKVQGTSSLAYDKKNYTINFFKNANYAEEMGVDVGWGLQDEYCLKANWIDKTHCRNVVTAKLAGEIQKKYGLLDIAPNNGAVDGFPVAVYINGSFHGLYTMNIPKDAWMFDMDTSNPNHIVICGENWTDPVLFKSLPTNFSAWSVEVGPENTETLEKIQRLIAFVRDSSDQEFKENFDQYLNLDATLNYYVMLNYCWLPDNAGKNMLLVTYDGNVWYPSLYDLDTSWGVNWKGNGLYNYQNDLLSTEDSILWQRLENLYKKEIAARYFELRSTILDTSYVSAKFNTFYNSIPKEVLELEKAKWDVAGTGKPIPGYPISQIQEYLDFVIPRLDAKFTSWK